VSNRRVETRLHCTYALFLPPSNRLYQSNKAGDNLHTPPTPHGPGHYYNTL